MFKSTLNVAVRMHQTQQDPTGLGSQDSKSSKQNGHSPVQQREYQGRTMANKAKIRLLEKALEEKARQVGMQSAAQQHGLVLDLYSPLSTQGERKPIQHMHSRTYSDTSHLTELPKRSHYLSHVFADWQQQ